MKVGHTGITWGIPGDVEQAYRDTAELGYLGFETFGRTIVDWNQKPGGYRALVERNGIPTGAAYCGRTWIEPQTADADATTARREADALRELGGETFVLACGRRPDGGYTADQFRRLAEGLNAVGAYCRSIGLVAGLHPHTGTAVETSQDIDAVMARLDPALVGFAPDTGQIAKGGGDVLAVLRRYRDRTTHVHLKDWNGHTEADDRSGYLNYQPIGRGVLPMREILDLYGDFGGWVNVELDGTPNAPRPPREAAAISRRFLGELLGDRVGWRGSDGR
ncbi:MAG TPA: sugar phosphate isomerase/epimerase [Chloroflexota bacterium]|jgi:inosose dehydratase|nr:sugar phosphate isomerase/epimerase [Chloroflexota bacterium]